MFGHKTCPKFSFQSRSRLVAAMDWFKSMQVYHELHLRKCHRGGIGSHSVVWCCTWLELLPSYKGEVGVWCKCLCVFFVLVWDLPFFPERGLAVICNLWFCAIACGVVLSECFGLASWAMLLLCYLFGPHQNVFHLCIWLVLIFNTSMRAGESRHRMYGGTNDCLGPR